MGKGGSNRVIGGKKLRRPQGDEQQSRCKYKNGDLRIP
jgi:hypothetical protein